jgi:hypothetical protein
MNVACSYDLTFSCYCGINMAVFCYGLIVAEEKWEEDVYR